MLLGKGRNWVNGNQSLQQSQPGSEEGKMEHPGGDIAMVLLVVLALQLIDKQVSDLERVHLANCMEIA
jgi:hypothetical protein